MEKKCLLFLVAIVFSQSLLRAAAIHEPDRVALYAACTSDDVNRATLVIAKYKNQPGELSLLLNHQNEQGQTPLHRAVDCESSKTIQLLLDHGAATHLPDKNGNVPLSMAILYNNAMYVDALLAHKTKLHDTESINGIHSAIYCRSIDFLNKILAMGANTNLITEEDGSIPLLYALQTNFAEGVERLLEHTTFINIQDNLGVTAVHAAVAAQDENIFEKVLAGRIRTSQVVSPSFLAHIMPTNNLLEAQTEGGYTPLMYAASRKNIAILKKLLDMKVAVDTQNQQGETALHLAAKNGNVEMVSLLIQAGASLNTTTKSGDTPLHYALREGQFASALELFEAGIDSTIENNNKKTAFACIKEIRNRDVLPILKKTKEHLCSVKNISKTGMDELLSYVEEVQKKHPTLTEIYAEIKEAFVPRARRLISPYHPAHLNRLNYALSYRTPSKTLTLKK